MQDSAKPDFALGLPCEQLAQDGMLPGRVGSDEVVLVRRGDRVFAIGAQCTHYHASLAAGLLVDDTVRCPMHHACFSLATGAALGAPALDPIDCWRVERQGERYFVREKLPPPPTVSFAADSVGAPRSVVIVGGGAAALAALVTLRREGYSGELTVISADDTAPYDRPNVSKDLLAGTAPEEWMALRASTFYSENRIDLRLNTSVLSIDLPGRQLRLSDGPELAFDALLLATGSEAAQVSIPGATPENLFYLRTLADCRQLLKRIKGARRAIVLGAGFVGLEAAASFRTQGLEVHVVAPDTVPLARVMGPELGGMLKQLHTSHGVIFHPGTHLTSIANRTFFLSDGSTIEADFVLAGVGARPRLDLARRAGLSIERGVVVDEYLQTSAAGVFAAGDIARYPAHFSGDRIRVEHWVAAQRQAQTAARNMLGRRERFTTVPFFWTQQYDVAINYVGHADHWDSTTIEGDIQAHNCTVRYLRAGRTIAVASVARDLENLKAELALERGG